MTSLTDFSTTPATILSASSDPEQAKLVAELSAESDVWKLMTCPVRKPTREEIYWVAGLFEGEGSFCGGHICIPQKEREILDEVRRLMGGKVGGPYFRTLPTGTRVSKLVWHATGPRGGFIARTLFHLLSTGRRAQARAFLAISRQQGPPRLDPADPTRLLWDWGPDDVLREFE